MDSIGIIISFSIIILFIIAVVIIPIYNRVRFRIKYGHWPFPNYSTAVHWKYLEGLPPEEKILRKRRDELKGELLQESLKIKKYSDEQLKKIRDEIKQIETQLYK